AGPVTGLPRAAAAFFGQALTLGPGGGRAARRPSGLHRRGGGGGRGGAALPIAAGLLPAVLPPVGAGAVLLLPPPPPPASRRLPAGRRAVAALRPCRPEQALATFEQAAAQPSPARPLQRAGRVGQ